MNGTKFIDNLDKINKERVSSEPVSDKKVESDVLEVIVDMDPKKAKQPKDHVFMDFMAMYTKTLNKNSRKDQIKVGL